MQDGQILHISEICGAVRIHASPNVPRKRENRPRWAIAIKHEGVTEYKSGGRTFLSDPTHICLLPRGSSYEWQTVGGECLMIEFEADGTGEEPVSIPVRDCSEIVNLYRRIEAERLRSDCSYAGFSALYRILSILLDRRETPYSLTRREAVILPAVTAMRERFSDPDFSVNELPALAGVSEVYFRKIFTGLYGVSPKEYLTHLRMKKAAELLKTDYASIGSVAESTGYHSLYHFSRMFKRYYGVSPNQYGRNV